MKLSNLATLVIISVLAGCTAAKVDVTKTGKGYYEPTKPAMVLILKTVPEEDYVELGTVTVTGFSSSDVAKMHNAIRAEAAPLGADAVIITDEGLLQVPYEGLKRWGTGVAIKYTEDK